MLYLYLSESTLFNVKSVFKFLNHGVSALEMYTLITFLGMEMLFIKQCSLKVLSDNKWWSTKVGAKMLSDLVIFSIFCSEIPLGFYDLIWVVPLKYLMYVLAGINTE